MDSEERRRYRENVYYRIREEWDRLEQPLKQSTGEVNQVSRPKIQRVPKYMGSRVEFKKYYLPQLISIGPISYDEAPELRRGNEYKSTWTAMYLKRTNQPVEDLHQRIFGHLDELRKQFDPRDCDYGWGTIGDCQIASWKLVLDGCSVLQVLEKSVTSVDPEQELKISIDNLLRVHQDLLILDNQIPFKLLRLLCNDESRLQKCLDNFLEIHGVTMAPRPSIEKPDLGKKKENKSTHNAQAAEELKVIVQADDHQDEGDPVHLLDYLRRALLKLYLGQIHKGVKNRKRSLHLRKYRIGTIRELKAAGIRVEKDPNNNSIIPSFKDGKLQLPELTVDGSTAHIFLNLIAYEMCPDFRNDFEISSFLVFMSSLIDQPEDVKELRSAGILINELANDKEVADLFNMMDIVLVPETAKFADVRDQIHMHFESKRRKIKILGWMGELYNTYLRSPWTIIALLAGSLGLVLTFIQTWFAVHPKGS